MGYIVWRFRVKFAAFFIQVRHAIEIKLRRFFCNQKRSEAIYYLFRWWSYVYYILVIFLVPNSKFAIIHKIGYVFAWSFLAVQFEYKFLLLLCEMI